VQVIESIGLCDTNIFVHVAELRVLHHLSTCTTKHTHIVIFVTLTHIRMLKRGSVNCSW